MKVYEQEVSRNTHLRGDFLFTDVWIKQAGSWKTVSRRVSRFPAIAVKGN
jgi:hypothetical protein